MRTLIAALLIISAGARAEAFDLASVTAASVAGSAAEVPAVPAAKGGADTVDAAYSLVKDHYQAGSYIPSELDMPGDWEGRLFTRDPQGGYAARQFWVSFEKKVYPSELGPMFQADTTEIRVRFPYFEGIVDGRLAFDPLAGAAFQFRWEGDYSATFRKMFHNGETVLVMKTDCYGGDAYGYLMKKKASSRQAYTGALPTGDLFGPLPPYFLGQIGPMIRNGYEVPGVLEYFSSIIFYTDKAEALAAARGAAARIAAAGGTVTSATAEEDRGVYTASVGFTGKKGVLYRWTDELPTYEEAAAVMKRKTARYESEGYSVMETRITKLGPKHAIFIICAKFY